MCTFWCYLIGQKIVGLKWRNFSEVTNVLSDEKFCQTEILCKEDFVQNENSMFWLVLIILIPYKYGIYIYGCLVKPYLKSCLFPIHQSGEIKNSLEPSAGRNFLQSLCLKKYSIKRFKKVSSCYFKNVTF